MLDPQSIWLASRWQATLLVPCNRLNVVMVQQSGKLMIGTIDPVKLPELAKLDAVRYIAPLT
jgi:hypothetical protein